MTQILANLMENKLRLILFVAAVLASVGLTKKRFGHYAYLENFIPQITKSGSVMKKTLFCQCEYKCRTCRRGLNFTQNKDFTVILCANLLSLDVLSQKS